ncbi:extracellular solute-binding protein, partial [Streptomyces ossamyceticus]|nr:extracellular solute-binding protein [Streptomyces ossamyceticus]
MRRTTSRSLLATALTTVVAVVGTACSSGSGSTGAAKDTDGGTYTIWDPYPQFDKGSAWAKLLDDCGTKAGVKVKRTAFDTSDLSNKALLAAQQDNSADVLIVDNPVVSTLAEAGVLTTTDENKLDTSQMDSNLLAAGQSEGKTYGMPIGANTLALYYNKEVLKKAGVDIASVKDWKSLTAALAKV